MKSTSENNSRFTFYVVLALVVTLILCGARLLQGLNHMGPEVKPIATNTAPQKVAEVVEQPVETSVTTNLSDGVKTLTFSIKPRLGKPATN